MIQSLLFCTALVARALAVQAQDDPDGWKRPTPPVKIVGPIHYVGTYGLAVYLIATPAGHILIDGGVPGSGPDIVRSIEAPRLQADRREDPAHHAGALRPCRARSRT